MAVTSLGRVVLKATITTTAAVAMALLAGQATATADVTNQVAKCHSTNEAGVDTDDCVGNPAADMVPDPGYQVWVEPRLFFGLGIG